MALEDAVLVTEEQIQAQYRRSSELGRNPSGFYRVLNEHGLLPLTVGTLTMPVGKALLRLATWTYFTGDIRINSRNGFSLRIRGKKTLLDNIIEKEIVHTMMRLSYFEENNGYGSIVISPNESPIARLVHAMGVPASQRGIREGKLRRPYYIGDSLPLYFWKILESSGNEPARQEMLMEILGIMFRDRYKSKGLNYGYLQLNTHVSEESARNYGASVIEFINKVFGENLFSDDQIRSTFKAADRLCNCRISVKPDQVQYLRIQRILPVI